MAIREYFVLCWSPLIRLVGLNRYDARYFVYGKLTIGVLIQDIAKIDQTTML